MAINSDTFVRDILQFIKEDLIKNITDPIEAKRINKSSKFIMTSYPQRETLYPLITIKGINYSFSRAGMQTTNMDGIVTLEIRIWATNEKEKDNLFTQVINRLKNIQFTINGSVEYELHDFNMPSAVEIQEEGDAGIKSKVMEVVYKFYNI
jgi:hypothetical protein